MEFFKTVDISTSEKLLQQLLVLQNMDQFCASVFPISEGSESCLMGSIWGEFTVRRDKIMGGVRFSMLDCPNALAWTITTGYPPAKDKVLIHATINRTTKPDEFIEEISDFLQDLHEGLLEFLGGPIVAV